ncbi:MAG: alpha/beta fold hydrolase [Pseudomonadota bacterium]
MLNVIDYPAQGAPTKPALVIAHGLFGSGRNWGVIAKRLSQDRRVLCVDMRNHAGSFWSDDMSYPAMAGDLAEVLEPLGEADLLGHSMGGKASMVAALSGAPIRRLIVADIAPVAYTHTQLHLIDAMEALDLAGLSTRGEADARLAQTVEDPTVRAFLLQSLDLKAGAWRLNLAALRAQMPEILGFPEVASVFQNPTLFLSGALSDYVSPASRPRMKELFPRGRYVKMNGVGHWLHAENPRAFETATRTFLDA